MVIGDNTSHVPGVWMVFLSVIVMVDQALKISHLSCVNGHWWQHIACSHDKCVKTVMCQLGGFVGSQRLCVSGDMLCCSDRMWWPWGKSDTLCERWHYVMLLWPNMTLWEVWDADSLCSSGGTWSGWHWASLCDVARRRPCVEVLVTSGWMALWAVWRLHDIKLNGSWAVCEGADAVFGQRMFDGMLEKLYDYQHHINCDGIVWTEKIWQEIWEVVWILTSHKLWWHCVDGSLSGHLRMRGL